MLDTPAGVGAAIALLGAIMISGATGSLLEDAAWGFFVMGIFMMVAALVLLNMTYPVVQ